MTSWVYVFSKFTPEALLFEALFICLLFAFYSAFWILKKRRLGAIDDAVPASLVKLYLGELIGDAEQMRAQLFGLLASHGALPSNRDASIPQISAALRSGASDPELQNQITLLETKSLEQTRTIDRFMSEKTKLERDLVDAKKGSSSSKDSDKSDAEIAGLKEKIHNLEARLAEYSVIEDDLANLKRLQQENTQLKAQLGKGDGAAEPVLSSPPPAASPSNEPDLTAFAGTGSAEPALTAQTSAAPEEAFFETAPPAVAVAKVAAEVPLSEPAAPQASADAGFEGLVDEVEKSLQQSSPEPTPPIVEESIPAAVAQAAAPAAPAPAPVPVAAPIAARSPAPKQDAAKPAKAAVEKTDEDLIAEFEKMLNS